jgi:hypothetical protein
MGGQTIAPKGYVIDMAYMKDIHLSDDRATVVTGPGTFPPPLLSPLLLGPPSFPLLFPIHALLSQLIFFLLFLLPSSSMS